MSEPKHLTHEEQDKLFKAFTVALQVGLIPIMSDYDDREDMCPGCVHWQLVRSLTVALCFFAKRLLKDGQTVEEFVAEIVTESEMLDAGDTVH
jgi:hypothetical protein